MRERGRERKSGGSERDEKDGLGETERKRESEGERER